VTAQATGDAARFDSVYKAFKVAQDVTSERLFIVTMEQILEGSKKVIIDQSAQSKSGVLPYLPLPSLLNSEAGSPAVANSAAGESSAAGIAHPTQGRRR
jgi:modulator of FtsH protease HflK